MGTVANMLRKVQALDVSNIVGGIVAEHTSELKELNIKQLMAGKNNKGELLAPRHSENPYFKKPGAGMRYAAWKKKLFPETPFDIPNLIIVGTYHDSIRVQKQGGSIVFTASAPFAGSIDSTFQNTPLGLSPESKQEAWKDIVRPPLIKQIALKLGVNE